MCSARVLPHRARSRKGDGGLVYRCMPKIQSPSAAFSRASLAKP
ncbi:hypothetical protein D516_1200 [Rhodobacter sp. AKP1]|nr:hypothetical protein D516_1200 [Rhodobacter sp. AKP1]